MSRLPQATDLLSICQLVFTAVLSLAVPESRWTTLTRLMTRLTERITPQVMIKQRKSVPSFLPGLLGWSPEATVRNAQAAHYEQCLQILRANFPPHWQPKVVLSGSENVFQAQAAGRGTILWVNETICSHLVTKVAFHAAGFNVTHLSQRGHGFASTPFGMRALNPFWTRIEDRYLAERLLLDDGPRFAALRVLHERLTSNGVVSVTVGPNGRQTGGVPLFNGSLQVALGIPHLAYSTGAAICPVFTTKQKGEFAVLIGKPFTIPQGCTRSQATNAILEQYGVALRAFLEEHAAMWTAWPPFSLN